MFGLSESEDLNDADIDWRLRSMKRPCSGRTWTSRATGTRSKSARVVFAKLGDVTFLAGGADNAGCRDKEKDNSPTLSPVRLLEEVHAPTRQFNHGFYRRQ